VIKTMSRTTPPLPPPGEGKPAPAKKTTRKGTPFVEMAWGPELLKYIEEVRLTYGHSILQARVGTGIPYSSLSKILEGGGGLRLDYFLALAKYARVSAPDLLRAILPSEQEERSRLRARVEAEPIAEQLAIAQEIMGRIQPNLIDIRRSDADPPAKGEPRKRIRIDEMEWWPKLNKYIDESRTTHSHPIHEIQRRTGIPYSSLHKILEGGGGLRLDYFLALAKYVLIPAPDLLRDILPPERGGRSPLRARIAVELIAEQVAISQEIMERLQRRLIEKPD
jgi:predicted transcriptional regulator